MSTDSTNGETLLNHINDLSRTSSFLGAVLRRGIQLWSENGELRYKAPKGALTQDEIEILRRSRNQVLALLERGFAEPSVASTLKPRGQIARVPLSYSQLGHWNFFRVDERPAIRQVASVLRLRGRLDVAALGQSFAETIRRHEALRTRILVIDGVPMQEVMSSSATEMTTEDLTRVGESRREAEILLRAEQDILTPIDVATDPLVGTRVLKLREDEHVLIVVMQHMISDGVSRGIFLRDTFAAYMQASQGLPFSLPDVPIQFADYAAWQRSAERSWIERRGEYWSRRLANTRRLRFPQDRDGSPSASPRGVGTVALRIDSELKSELSEWCRRRGSTLAMSAFAAYVAVVLRWCNASEAVVLYATDGRITPSVANTIGFFASVLYVPIDLAAEDSFTDLANHITQAYCHAYEQADFSYTVAQVPQPEFTQNTGFNWIPRGSINVDAHDLGGLVSCSPISFTHPLLRQYPGTGEPTVGLYDVDDGIIGSVYFPVDRFSAEGMERFGRNFIHFIIQLLRRPQQRVIAIPLVD